MARSIVGGVSATSQWMGLLQRERLAPAHAVMVGDRAFDVVAARANCLRAVGVLWGYGSERELREAGAERLCATPVELPAVIAQLSVRGS